jgi:LmbE family N-acetylglucosaminyl deacetylase
VAFHAHPDDEALLTGGVLARASYEGHRVVLVTATDGERGLARDHRDLGERRRGELERAAVILGVCRTVRLGYTDSGYDDPPSPPPGSFATVPVSEAAERLADVLAEERADVLTVYDDHGGYGHRDHIQVHRIGVAAAALAGTPRVLAATVEREALLRGVRLLRHLRIRIGGAASGALPTSFTEAAAITHEIDVRRWVGVKRAALRAHASQTGGADVRTVALLGRLPGPLARRVLGREWFVELGAAVPAQRLDDVFAAADRSIRVAE